MMKHFAAMLAIFLILFPIAGCGSAGDTGNSPDAGPETSPAASEYTAVPQPADETDKNISAATDTRGKRAINFYCPTIEESQIIEMYQELHPDFPYKIAIHHFGNVDTSYYGALDKAFAAGGEDMLDICMVNSGYVEKYARGAMARYAAPYGDLGIDVDTLLKESDIYQYVIDMGTNADGQLVALSYQGTGGAFIYRRSIAKDVWGTDDPEMIKDKIGPGWDRFLKAADELMAAGYAIVSGPDDIWHAVENSAELPWVVDGKLVIDPRREAFLDLAKTLHDNGYTNNTTAWLDDDWFNAMRDAGPKKVFGYFAPAWMVNYTIKTECGGEKPGEGTYGDWAVCEPPAGFFWGGLWVFVNKYSEYKEELGDLVRWITLDSSETGFQYSLANGAFPGNEWVRDAVTSGTVMKKVSGVSDFLGGQDMFHVFDKAARLASGKNVTQYDTAINSYWLAAAREYVEGRKTREQAILDFKKQVKDKLGIAAE